MIGIRCWLLLLLLVLTTFIPDCSQLVLIDVGCRPLLLDDLPLLRCVVVVVIVDCDLIVGATLLIR